MKIVLQGLIQEMALVMLKTVFILVLNALHKNALNVIQVQFYLFIFE